MENKHIEKITISFNVSEDNVIESKAHYQMGKTEINVSFNGDMILTDGKEIFERFVNYLRGLEAYCPSRCCFTRNSPPTDRHTIHKL